MSTTTMCCVFSLQLHVSDNDNMVTVGADKSSHNPCPCVVCSLLLPSAPSSTPTGNPWLVRTSPSEYYHINTFTTVEKSSVVRSSIFLKEEFLPIGESERMKARLVAGGNMQHMDMDCAKICQHQQLPYYHYQ